MRRVLPFLIIFVVAAIAAGAGGWLYRSKMKSASSAPAAVAQTIAAPQKKNPPQPLHARGGPADAPVILEIFGDFQCPPCATTSALIDELGNEYGPRLRVVYREFPLAMHAHAMQAAMAAEAAGRHGRFWEMHDLLYENQKVWSESPEPERLFTTYAESLGLKADRFSADASSAEVKALVDADGADGQARGVRNTPTIFVNGWQMRGLFTRASLQVTIESALDRKKKS